MRQVFCVRSCAAAIAVLTRVENRMIKKKVRVSKFLSFILRHSPQDFELRLDRHGFSEFQQVLEIMKKRFPGLEEEDLRFIVDSDSKRRFQIEGQRIRARYGHSVDVDPLEECPGVPEFLFHGTSPKSLDSIIKRGLKPGGRSFVHLSVNVEEALKVGGRKNKNPVVLKIKARKASQEGQIFWKEENIYLTKSIAPKYLSVYK